MLSIASSMRAVPTRPGRARRTRSQATAAGTVEAVVTERLAWERRERESARHYEAFRMYRDAGPMRRLEPIAEHYGVTLRAVQMWLKNHDWAARALAWDDECHAVEDRQRLESIRQMHDTHSRAAKAAIGKALAALAAIPPADLPAGAAVRLLEVGTRLERETLTTSVEELQGVARAVVPAEDPWEAIARELQGVSADAD